MIRGGHGGGEKDNNNDREKKGGDDVNKMMGQEKALKEGQEIHALLTRLNQICGQLFETKDGDTDRIRNLSALIEIIIGELPLKIKKLLGTAIQTYMAAGCHKNIAGKFMVVIADLAEQGFSNRAEFQAAFMEGCAITKNAYK